MEYEMRRLKDAAIEEAARVMLARAHAVDATAADGDRHGPLVTRARHRDTRRILAGRCLLVFRISCNDASGRAVAMRIVGVLMAMAVDPDLRPRDRIRAALGRADAMVRPHVHRTSSNWMRDTERFGAAFGRARLQRERAIEQQRYVTKPQRFQAGLFDRRAERDAMNESAALADRDQAMRARIRVAERSRVVESVTELLLVLTP
jgi:hypothetical protein